MKVSDRKQHDPVGWLVRVAWQRRLETGLTLATSVARVGLAAAIGPVIGNAVMAICALAVVLCEPSRKWMIGLYRRERLERHYGKVFAGTARSSICDWARRGRRPVHRWPSRRCRSPVRMRWPVRTSPP